ncbi:MAG: MFS transporter [Caulobacteraceae bacterium]
MSTATRPFGQNYAFVVAGVTFVALLTAAGLRATPGVLLTPWQTALGWDRATISFAAATGIFLYGLVGPFGAALMQSLGIRKTLAAAFVVMSAGAGLSLMMTEPWQLVATWGVMTGLGTGCVAMSFAAVIVNRWFAKNRGLMTGLLTAATATGNLIFLPAFAAIAASGGWKPVVTVVAVATAVMAPLVFLLIPDRPAEAGLLPYGTEPGDPLPPEPVRQNPIRMAVGALVMAAGKRDFWLLFGAFFICGFTTNGLIGTHMISLCGDHGMLPVMAASVMAMMGLFDLVGTTASGWLTDRFDSRRLLFLYYVLRGLSLIYLPFSDFSLYGLSLFAVFYGLDWIATVPPTLRLTNKVFGEASAPIVYGWIAAGHQAGAASAAFLGGVIRTQTGSYLDAFLIAGGAAVAAGVMSLLVGRGGGADLRLAPSGAA